MIEAEFIGGALGRFAGFPDRAHGASATTRVAYDLRADTITAVRLYFPMDVLVRQLRDRGTRRRRLR